MRRTNLFFFGAEKQMHTITKEDVRRFVLKLSQSIEEGGFGLAQNTTAPRTIGYCRQIFSRAIDDQILSANPFKQASVTATVGRGAGVYVPRDVRQKIYDVLPDNIWRLRHLLIYKNGLACPSELNHLKWSDIDWENQTMLIHKQKTKINRKAFIMDAVMPILEAVYDAAPEGQVYVVPSLTNTHMARMYHKFQIKADVNDWNCIFISLRKSAVQDAYTWAQQTGLESHVARVSCDRPLVWSHEGRQ